MQGQGVTVSFWRKSETKEVLIKELRKLFKTSKGFARLLDLAASKVIAGEEVKVEAKPVAKAIVLHAINKIAQQKQKALQRTTLETSGFENGYGNVHLVMLSDEHTRKRSWQVVDYNPHFAELEDSNFSAKTLVCFNPDISHEQANELDLHTWDEIGDLDVNHPTSAKVTREIRSAHFVKKSTFTSIPVPLEDILKGETLAKSVDEMTTLFWCAFQRNEPIADSIWHAARCVAAGGNYTVHLEASISKGMDSKALSEELSRVAKFANAGFNHLAKLALQPIVNIACAQVRNDAVSANPELVEVDYEPPRNPRYYSPELTIETKAAYKAACESLSERQEAFTNAFARRFVEERDNGYTEAQKEVFANAFIERRKNASWNAKDQPTVLVTDKWQLDQDFEETRVSPIDEAKLAPLDFLYEDEADLKSRLEQEPKNSRLATALAEVRCAIRDEVAAAGSIPSSFDALSQIVRESYVSN